MRLTDALSSVVSRYPGNTALCFKGGTLSYEGLWKQSEAVGRWLRHRGVRSGDRVGILADHGIEPVVIAWGILKAGAIVVYLNEYLQPDGLQEILSDCEPVIVFTTRHCLERRLARVGGPVSAGAVVIDEAFRDIAGFAGPSIDGARTEAEANGDEDIAAIVYTSGSQGRPKGVCLTHRNLLFTARVDCRRLNVTAQDAYLMLVPLHYVHGMLQMLIHLLNGAAVHLAGGFLFPRAIVGELADKRITGVSGVPFHLNALMDRGGLLQAPLPHLRWLAVTGGKFSRERLHRLRRHQPHVDIFITYGQTECSPRITVLDPVKIDRKPDSVGASPPGIRVRVVDEAGAPSPAGETGEVVVKGANVMAGYWRNPEDTARVIDKEGWLHTGDLGWFDAEGDLYLVGRKQAMIKSAGERVFPEEIERVIAGHPAVADVAVIGVPDAFYGQRIEADIQVAEDRCIPDTALLEEIRGYCLARIPLARAPRHFRLWRTLPRKANGKIDRQALIGISRGVAHGPACPPTAGGAFNHAAGDHAAGSGHVLEELENA
jgi:acyl-CoA synthetase (AMP-forming)/AMP-acid ligase II